MLEISRCHLNAKAFTNLKYVVTGIMKRAKKLNLISFNVVTAMNEVDLSEVKFTKTVKKEEDEVYDERELGIVLDYLYDYLDLMNLGVLLIFFTGLRVGEQIALKWEDIDYIIRVCRIETAYRNEGKHTKLTKSKTFPRQKPE